VGKGSGGLGGVVSQGLGMVSPILGGMSTEREGARAAAKAAEKAAGAQAGMARTMRGEVLDQASRNERDVMNLASASPQELAALSRSYSSAEQSLAREEKMIAALDPALLEASQQALKLMRGESAAVNGPMQQMRNAQRQQMVNSLLAQYGPGAESSSIGQRMLQQFDMESSNMFQQNQQSSLAQMFGMATSDAGGRQRAAIGQMQQVGQGYGALQERQMNARLNLGAQSLGALTGTSQQMISSAGAPFVGDALRAQGDAAFGGQMRQTGMAVLGAFGGGGGGKGGGGAAKPTGGGNYNGFGDTTGTGAAGGNYRDVTGMS